MYSYAVTFFILLCLSLILSVLRAGGWAIFARILQWIITITSIIFFVWWIFEKSFSNIYGNKSENNISIKIVNRLPENIDFYAISCMKDLNMDNCINHIGKIKQNYYREIFFPFDELDEYKLLGFMTNKKLVYYSSHSTQLQILEIKDLINQDRNISDSLVKEINNYTDKIAEKAILVCLSFLLIFLHLAFLTKRKNTIKTK